MGCRKISFKLLVFLMVPLLLAGCQRGGDGKPNGDGPRVVFKHGKIAGDPAPFRELIERFEKETGIEVQDEVLPASTDEQHQFYVINLEGKSSEFDVLSMDVIWVPEFSRAGWLADLTHLLPEEEREDFFPGPMEAVAFEGSVYAVPWYIDAGLLYYRTDLLEKYGFSPPGTWHDLVRTARHITEREPGLYGFIWQGKQYEGLEFTETEGDVTWVTVRLDGISFKSKALTEASPETDSS